MTTAEQYLNSLLSTYTPSSTYFDKARTHRYGIEARLDAQLGVSEMFETGSLKHGTGVAWYSDADYIVALKGSRPSSTTSLNNVKAALQLKFPNTEIVIRRPAVVCRFATGTEVVEVVPAYPADSGYWIPDPTGEWMKTHPKAHNSYVNEVNKKHGGGAKKLARAVKIWKYKRSVPLSSCYLEMRAAAYADGEASWYPVVELYYFLKRLEVLELAAMNDPTGLGSRFTAYSSASNKTDAMSKLSRAVGRASLAMTYSNDGRNALAIEQLKLLFNQ